jgi:hypothetical protein
VPPDLGLVRINSDVEEKTIAELTARGHKINAVRSAIWVPTMLTIDPTTRQIQGAGDPKAGRHAAAY